MKFTRLDSSAPLVTKFHYLASPYTGHSSGDLDLAYREVSIFAGSLLKRGFIVFAPICHSHSIGVLGGVAENWNFWEHYDRHFMDVTDCCLVARLDGWDASVGVTAEREYFFEQGKEVFHVDPLTFEFYREER